MKRRALAKANTHERILASAGKLVRTQGLGGASVVRVMRGAGLTVGGFYAHFRSKSAMDAEVLRAALGEMRQRWFTGLERSSGLEWVRRAVRRYLSPVHRDLQEEGCAFPRILSELAQADAEVRQAAIEAFLVTADEFTPNTPAAGDITARERALATLALCIGGLTLARGLRDHPLSDEILDACVKWATVELPTEADRTRE